MSDCDGSGFPVLSCHTWGVIEESVGQGDNGEG